MFYFPIISSSIEEDKCLCEVKNKLEELQQSEILQILKEKIDDLVYWNKKFVNESNHMEIQDTCEYGEDYLELQRLINKIMNVEV